MKKIIFLFLISIFAVSGFAQSLKTAKIMSNAKEDGQGTVRNFLAPSIIDAPPPSFTIPGTDGFWDYMTNGSNMQNLAVFGDTIIVCYPNTDSTDPTGANSRVAYYLVSVNGGVTWEAPLAVSTLPDRSAYTEVQSFILGGGRQVTLNGRRYVGSSSRGGAWKDAFFGLGSFTGANAPTEGRDFFGQHMGGGIIGGLFNIPNGTTEPIFDTLFFSKYNSNTNTFSTRIKIAEPSLGQIGGNSRYHFSCDQTGNNCLALWYKDTLTGAANSGLVMSTSSNGGTSWTIPSFIQKTGRVNDFIGGDTVAPWFGIDAAFKPASTNYGVVWSTIYPNRAAGNYLSINTSSKILFQSPSINGGVPVVVAGRNNMTIVSDTAQFNNRQNLQIGVLPLSHPSIAYSADGSRIVCTFSAFQPGDSLDGFTRNDIWYTWSDDGGATWNTPVNLTNTHDYDELYPCLSLTGNTTTSFKVHYQSTVGPGSQSFYNNAPTYRVYQCLRTITLPNSVNNISSNVPDKFSLQQNYPNPFNPTTAIRFDVVKSTKMTLSVYDVSGKLVQTLLNNEAVPTGTNEVVFDAGKLSSGVYFYTLSSDNFRETKKMMLVK